MQYDELVARLKKRGLTENQAQDVLTELVLQKLIWWDRNNEVHPGSE